MKVASQFAIRELVAYKPVVYKKNKCICKIVDLDKSRLSYVQTNVFFSTKTRFVGSQTFMAPEISLKEITVPTARSK